MLHEYMGKWPKLGERVYIAEGAQIVGDVEIGDHSSVWYNCVIRGDVDIVRIGKHTNIQDNAVIHVTHFANPTEVGERVTVGHAAVLHGCTIKDGALSERLASLHDRWDGAARAADVPHAH